MESIKNKEDIEQMYKEALKRGILENQDRIDFWDNAINLSNAAFIGSICATVVTSITSPESTLVGSSVLSILVLVANIIAHLRKRTIEGAHDNITSMEKAMLDKAYHFYTEGMAR